MAIKYYAQFDDIGFPLAFYRDDINTEIPDGAVSISESHWQEFTNNNGNRRWNGTRPVVGSPEPLPLPPVAEVTMRQAKIQLSRSGFLLQADEAIQSMPGQQGEEARIEWQYATTLRRDHPLVAALGSQLGLTDQQIDNLFDEASQI